MHVESTMLNQPGWINHDESRGWWLISSYRPWWTIKPSSVWTINWLFSMIPYSKPLVTRLNQLVNPCDYLTSKRVEPRAEPANSAIHDDGLEFNHEWTILNHQPISFISDLPLSTITNHNYIWWPSLIWIHHYHFNTTNHYERLSATISLPCSHILPAGLLHLTTTSGSRKQLTVGRVAKAKAGGCWWLW